MGRDSDAIRAVKDRLDMVEVVRRYVDLKPVSGRWVGPCPFHQETKGSFSVNPERGFYYCFGCQATGDVIDFYMRINGLEFPEALEALAAETGVELRTHRPDPDADKKKQRKNACYAMHELAARHFAANLLSPQKGQNARRYVKRRGFPSKILEKFAIGYGLDAWQDLQEALRRKGFSPAQGVEAGVLSQNDKGRAYDRFRDRLIFPITDMAGRVIAFGGRIVGDGDPKYLNSSDSPIYKKGEHLYGLHQARPVIARSKRALLTEGYVDVISLHQYGYEEAVGVLGTALTSEQVRRIAGFCTAVDLVFDGDRAGQKAAFRSAEMILTQGLTCRIIPLPDGKDVDDVLQQGGKDAFAACLNQAIDGLDFCVDTVTATGSAREVMQWSVGFLQNLGNSDWYAYFIPRIAAKARLSESLLREAVVSGLEKAQHLQRRQTPSHVSAESLHRDGDSSRTAAKTTNALSAQSFRDQQLLALPIRNPELVDHCRQAGLEEALSTSWAQVFWDKLSDNDGASVIERLNESEKPVWARLQMTRHTPCEEEDDSWEGVDAYLQLQKATNRAENLNSAIRDAQGRGDTPEIDRLWPVYQQCQKTVQYYRAVLSEDTEEAERLRLSLAEELHGRSDEQS